MRDIGIVVVCLLVLAVVVVVGSVVGWGGTWFSNKVEFVDRKIDDATKYDTIKKVEDTCRAMISSYTSDKLTYEQYRGSTDDEKLEWAEQAKMRANKTAASYNEYVLKNSFVWQGNVPDDIRMQLDYLE